jgi:hypothetical protein
VLGRGYYVKGPVPDAPGRLCYWQAVRGVLEELGISDGDRATERSTKVVMRAVLAAIRICPLATMKMDRSLSQSVIGFPTPPA